MQYSLKRSYFWRHELNFIGYESRVKRLKGINLYIENSLCDFTVHKGYFSIIFSRVKLLDSFYTFLRITAVMVKCLKILI